MDMLVNDVKLYFARIRRHYTQQPIFVLGVSMGGHITLRLAKEIGSEIAGIIIAVPFVDFKDPFMRNWFMRRVLLSVGRYFDFIHGE
jgi:alpha-beta hydrolase superfamily lysophospholipase